MRYARYNLKDYNPDNVRTGHFVTRMYEHFPEAKNLRAMNTLMLQLNDQPRNQRGCLLAPRAIYAYQVWLDGIFMGLPYRVLTRVNDLCARTGSPDLRRCCRSGQRRPMSALSTQPPVSTAMPGTKTATCSGATTKPAFRSTAGARPGLVLIMALVELLDALPEDYARRGG